MKKFVHDWYDLEPELIGATNLLTRAIKMRDERIEDTDGECRITISIRVNQAEREFDFESQGFKYKIIE